MHEKIGFKVKNHLRDSRIILCKYNIGRKLGVNWYTRRKTGVNRVSPEIVRAGQAGQAMSGCSDYRIDRNDEHRKIKHVLEYEYVTLVLDVPVNASR